MRWTFQAVGLCCVMVGWGCGPPEIVPVAPPGLEFKNITPETTPEEDLAEALGETRATASLQPQNIQPAEPTELGKPRTTESGLTYETLKPGDGPAAASGKQVSVHYTGTLAATGEKFDSSLDKGKPFDFALGTGAVIKGWDQGVVGMKVGERRKLTIPPDLAYGKNPPPGSPIPPDSTLVFEVELLSVK